MNRARACIFARGVFNEPVRVTTCCLISGEASRRPWVSPLYQAPMSFHVRNPRLVPPGGMRETTMEPATPLHGGISGSHFTSGISFTIHCDWPLADELDKSSW